MESALLAILLCLLTFSSKFATSAPKLEQKAVTLYDAIVEECPKVKDIKDYQNGQIFQVCKNWENIKALSGEQEILCLLYYDGFTLYCKNAVTINTTVDFKVVASYDINTVCDNATVIFSNSETAAMLKSVIKNKEDCKNICRDEMGIIRSVCSVAYYFGRKSQIAKTSDIKSSNIVQKVSSTVEVQPAKNPVPVLQNKLQQTAKELIGAEIKKPSGNADNEKLSSTAEIKKPSFNVEQIVTNNVASKKADTNSEPVIPSAEAASTFIDKNSNKDVHLEENGSVIMAKKLEQKSTTLAPDLNLLEKVPIEPNNPAPAPDVDDENANENDTPIQENAEPEEYDMGISEVKEESKVSKPHQTDESEPVNYSTEMDGDSYFFTYFMMLSAVFIVGYICYHNKQKILALILEGRRGKKQFRGRRPNSANYHKLDSNLEEAITSSCSKNSSNVIY